MSEIGKLIGNFQILGDLGGGGFGQTFLACDTENRHEKCVVKKLNPPEENAESAKIAKRLFEQEAEILYRLGEHRQIPALITHFEENGEFYLVQEYIEGETIAQEISAGKIYRVEEVWQMMLQIVRILHFVHGHEVIHRDIKPSNIIRRKSDGELVLIDFGAGKKVTASDARFARESTATVAVGSDGYMPIEQIAGHPRYGSDIYAVGMLAIQLLTQVHPSRLYQNQRTGEWIWQDKISLNHRFAAVINQMVRYDFRQRYASAGEVFAALKNLPFHLPQVSMPAEHNRRESANSLPPQTVETNPIYQSNQIFDAEQAFPPNRKLPPAANQTQLTFAAHENRAFSKSENPHSAKTGNYTRFQIPPTPARPQTDVIFSDNSEFKPLKTAFWGMLVFFTLLVTFSSFIANSQNYSDYIYKSLTGQKDYAEVAPAKVTETQVFEQAEKAEKEAAQAQVYVPKKEQWFQINQKWREAATLYEAVPANYPRYLEAKNKVTYCREQAENAYNAGRGIAGKTSSASTSSTSSSTSYSPSYTSSTSRTSSSNPPTYSATPFPSATPTPKPAVVPIPSAKAGNTYLAIGYTTGSYREQVKTETFTPADGNFSASVSKSQYKGMVVRISFDGGPDNFSLEFAASQNNNLSVGAYSGVTRAPFQSPTKAGFSFSGRGSGCNELTADFTINRIGFSADYTKLLYLEATFSQRCEHRLPAQTGRIRYTAQ